MSEMMQLFREVMSDFADNVDVPEDHYDMMIYVWRRMNEQGSAWDEVKAAALLLNIMHRDGLVHRDQINAEGNLAMKWAEDYLEDTNVVTFIEQYKTSNYV